MKLGLVLLVLSSSNFATSAAAQSGPPAVPQANSSRPTVSNPAALTPVGYLQFQNGVLFAEDSPEFSNRVGINQVTKLTVHPRLELIMQFEPLVRRTAGGRSALQTGGISAGLQGVLLPGSKSRPTVSVGYFYTLYSGTASDIDIGSFRHSALLLVSGDIRGFHFDLNGIASEQVHLRLRRAQFGQTLAISHPLGRFTLTGEIWHFSQPLVRSNAIGNLWALSYSLRPNLVLDAGFNYGFTNTSTRWEGFFGFTYLLPHRLWKDHHTVKAPPS